MKISYMKEALKEANKAYKKKEVPVGAVIVKDDKIIARGHNLKEIKQDSTAHAEINAIHKASKKTGSWRLRGCDIYVTLEPCAMCAGAIIQSRIDNVFFGAYDKKSGSIVSCAKLFDVIEYNHHPNYMGGILIEDCSILLSEFFKELREELKEI